MPFSAPTGFMVPPLHGVSSAVSCSGTLDQGSLFRFRVHSNYSVVVVIWTFVVRAIYTCPVIGVRCCKAWDIHPVLKNVFFFSDSRFVIRAIYLPSLFQPLPRWWTITRGTFKIWPDNYILSVNAVGYIYNTFPPSMNPVGAALWWIVWIRNSEHPAGGGLHGGATPAGCSFLFFFLDHFNFNQEWFLLEFFCVHRFKGVTPLGRHTRPACN